MIDTFFSTATLDTPAAFLTALLLGVLFGIVLEQAGFGSSRRLAGVFYLTDMTVIKVMFTGLITAALGLSALIALGWLDLPALYLMPTVYGAMAVGGLIFGLGFAMAGWCPGTAAVGLASGKLDALVFLVGAILGSILFNELFPLLEPLSNWGATGVIFIYDTLGMTRAGFLVLFTLMAVLAFWLVEFLGWRTGTPGELFASRFLSTLSLALLLGAGSLYVVADMPAAAPPGEAALLSQVATAADHMEPEDLADRLLRQDPGLLVVDIRSPQEFAAFHLRGAVNLPLEDLPGALVPHKNRRTIVLYSNGMTHPAQARDSLARQGFTQVYILTDGLAGFLDRCLKPASLRLGLITPADTARISAWRAYFLASPAHSP